MSRHYLPPLPERFGDLPRSHGVMFTCRRCGRPYAVARDVAIRTWGERGVILEAAAKLRCRSNCRQRGMLAGLTLARAGMGSKDDLTRLVEAIRALRPRGRIE